MGVGKINGHEVGLGCYIDGHWGQYGPDRLAALAEVLGYPFGPDRLDPRDLRIVADRLEERDWHSSATTTWEAFHDAADQIEQWMIDNAEDCVPCWIDGEFFILSHDDYEDCWQ